MSEHVMDEFELLFPEICCELFALTNSWFASSCSNSNNSNTKHVCVPDIGHYCLFSLSICLFLYFMIRCLSKPVHDVGNDA